jgi:hypothetical protein
LDEVENPSILKTGQLDPNTVSDQPLAAAPYRASDLVLLSQKVASASDAIQVSGEIQTSADEG